MLNRRMILLVASGIACLAASVVAAQPQGRARPVNTIGSPAKVAIRGYDPVAYFVEGEPRRGKPAFTVERNGAVWWFSSAANKARFEADPDKYLPAYGGFCAYGTSRGYLVKIEPEAWSIVGGRLYLNYDLGVRATWSKDARGYISKADANWPDLTAEDVQ